MVFARNTNWIPVLGWPLSGPKVRSPDSGTIHRPRGWGRGYPRPRVTCPLTSSVNHLSPCGLGTIAETSVHSFCVETPRARHLSYLGFSVAASGYQVSCAQTPAPWLELSHLTLADGPGWVRGCTGPMGAPTQPQLSRAGPSLASNFCSDLEPVLKWTWARWLV